jgi:hypothetical protein
MDINKVFAIARQWNERVDRQVHMVRSKAVTQTSRGECALEKDSTGTLSEVKSSVVAPSSELAAEARPAADETHWWHAYACRAKT